MMNQKGFTLVEVLLGAMIVGLIGMALAALTTAAVRESGVGRTRMMLRNQLSMAIRQLRQDVMMATSITNASGGNLTLSLAAEPYQVGPGTSGTITYSSRGGTIYRQRDGEDEEAWLSNVVAGGSATFSSPEFMVLPMVGCTGESGSECVNSVLRVRMIIGTSGQPSVKESMEEIIALPQGFVTKLTP